MYRYPGAELANRNTVVCVQDDLVWNAFAAG